MTTFFTFSILNLKFFMILYFSFHSLLRKVFCSPLIKSLGNIMEGIFIEMKLSVEKLHHQLPNVSMIWRDSLQLTCLKTTSVSQVCSPYNVEFTLNDQHIKNCNELTLKNIYTNISGTLQLLEIVS